MGFALRKLVAVIVFCISINVLVCFGRRNTGKNSGSEALYECIQAQMCKCNKPERFGGCYEHLTEKSQEWFVDQLNTCNLVEFEYGKIIEGLQNICSHDSSKLKTCFDENNSKLMQRYKEVAMGMHGPEENPAFEKARTCLEAILAFCQSSPDMCMSVG
ncbi:uncharacterized protein LOC129972702 [Argiope bruennichi]|uniref:Uncharacterized protein n=1 Tax=Argiope bruennichi TaxID=94029 RepID=A0A8T0FCT7_ARGBR|nr:uncharacterized protein LOC129972702 [Argiope bruennichi]KAF8787130.1 hypothetical protein HNY73_008758 [Argiope bruennichi]